MVSVWLFHGGFKAFCLMFCGGFDGCFYGGSSGVYGIPDLSTTRLVGLEQFCQVTLGEANFSSNPFF